MADSATGRAPTTLYRLREKTIWAQIATIDGYLWQFFVPQLNDERPYALYRDDGARTVAEDGAAARARIDVAAARIDIAGARIDQRTGVWYNVQGQVLGQCVAVSRRQGYAQVREFLGQSGAATANNSTARSTRPSCSSIRLC